MDRFNAFTPDELAVLVEVLAIGVQSVRDDAALCGDLHDEATAAQLAVLARPLSPDEGAND